MTRTKLKPDEIFAKRYLCQYLDKNYTSYEIDESITDDPDFVFEHESKRIGVEFSHITIPQLMEWAARKQYDDLEHDARYIITIPIEPHMWVQKVLRDKNVLYEKYINSSDLDECWLLLHQGDNGRKWFIPKDEKLILVLKIYASNFATKYKRILYLHQEEKIIDIRTDEFKGLNSISRGLSIAQKGWPTQVIHHVRTTPKGKTTINIDDVPIKEHIFIPYLEPNVYHGDPDANA
jgi:hypothetical protein